MPLYFKTSQNQKIRVQDTPLSNAGAEGQVHRILAPSSYQNHCVKIFHPPKRTPECEQKIAYMVNHLPSELKGETYMICWPTELIYQNGQFVGFIMALAFEGSLQIYELCRPILKNNLPNEWHKFDLTTDNGVILRLKLCVNIAIAVHKIHSLNHYVLVDMKPQNMLVTEEGKISIIDLDSIQIANNSNLEPVQSVNGSKVSTVIHPSHAVTAEYIPPEGYQNNWHPSKNYIPISWDRFSMAVIFYEVLFGLPPFSATYGEQYADCDTIPDKIQNGLFPHGSKSKYITCLPKWHHNFQQIPEPLKILFLKAFEEGHHKPSERPSAEIWGQVLFREITQLQTCKHYQIRPTTQKNQHLTGFHNDFNNLKDRTHALYSRMVLLIKNAFSSLSSSLLTLFNNYFN
ncbi:MAG: hypothetical protein DRR19_03855 [Candidatus Parabeggiatoa sp. nov. 1]|nr:MAG: hypothetical protein DRR19_03855 [Gammaproteobacteria bacterium]